LEIGNKNTSSEDSDKNGKSTVTTASKEITKKAKKTRLTPQLIRLSRTEITTKPEPNFKIS